MTVQRVPRGTSTTFDAQFRVGVVLTDATSVLIDITDPDGVEVVSNAAPTSHPATGIYTYDFEAEVDAKLGVWTISWAGVVSSTAVDEDSVFEVTPEVTVTPGGEGSFASLEDFVERKGPVSEEEEPAVLALLADASALILDEVSGSTATWVTESGDVPHSVKAICVAVAYRAWSNPDGLSQSSIADSSLSYAGARPDALYLTDDEKRILDRAAGTSSVVSVTLVSPYSGDSEISALDFWPDGL